MKTTVKIVEQQELCATQKESMWKIYKNFYHYSKNYFMERTQQNTHFALYIRDGKIGGFTGLRINTIKLGGKHRFLIYYGQTIVPWGFSGTTLLPLTATKLIFKFWKELIFHDAWFWYDSLTYKAYLISAKSLAEYYPNFRSPGPVQAKQIVNFIGHHYYGKHYNPKTGTVSKSKNFVKQKRRTIYERLLKDQDIAFYAKANPGHTEGYGLLTYSPINFKNIYALVSGSLKKCINEKRKKWSRHLDWSVLKRIGSL